MRRERREKSAEARSLVIGGAGFIGSNLVRKLIKLGYEVSVFDDFSNGTHENLEGIEAFIHEVDISDRAAMEKITKHIEPIDTIYHLACTALLPSFEDPWRDVDVNGKGMLNTIWLAKKWKANVVYTSSGSVYADDVTLPVTESDKLAPASPYGASKLIAENYLRVFAEHFGFNAFSLRLYNVYGPRQKISPEIDWIPVVPKFIRDCIYGEKSVIYGDGKQTRDFNFVDDVVDAIIMAAQFNYPNHHYAVCNVASNKETSINDLYYGVRKLFGQEDVEPRYEPMKPGDLGAVRGSYYGINTLLGWKPSTSLEEGLKISKDFYEKVFRRD